MATEVEVKLAEALLAEHYKEPVMPVSKYCDAFRTWANAISQEGAGYDGEFDRLVDMRMSLELAIRKSNLLWRLLYLGESLRTVPCPEHKGHWSGCQLEPCPHGCNSGADITGWLPNEE